MISITSLITNSFKQQRESLHNFYIYSDGDFRLAKEYDKHQTYYAKYAKVNISVVNENNYSDFYNFTDNEFVKATEYNSELKYYQMVDSFTREFIEFESLEHEINKLYNVVEGDIVTLIIRTTSGHVNETYTTKNSTITYELDVYNNEIGDVTSSYELSLSASITIRYGKISYAFEHAAVVDGNYTMNVDYDGEEHGPMPVTITENARIRFLVGGQYVTTAPRYTEAGTYRIMYYVDVVDENNEVVEGFEPIEATFVLKIEKIPYDFNLVSDHTVTYTGKAYEPVIKHKDSDGNYTIERDDYDVSYEIVNVTTNTKVDSIVNVGTYSLKVIVYGSNNYKMTENTYTIIVTRAASSIKFEDIDQVENPTVYKIYDGYDYEAITSRTETIKVPTETYVLVEDKSEINENNVANYYVLVNNKYVQATEYDAEADYYTMVIVDVDSETEVFNYTLIGDGQVVVHYYENDVELQAGLKPVNVGTYRVVVQVLQSDNYNGTSYTYTLVISKRDLYIGKVDSNGKQVILTQGYEKDKYFEISVDDLDLLKPNGTGLAKDTDLMSRLEFGNSKIRSNVYARGDYSSAEFFDIVNFVITENGTPVTANYNVIIAVHLQITAPDSGITVSGYSDVFDNKYHSISLSNPNNIPASEYSVLYGLYDEEKDKVIYSADVIEFKNVGTYTVYYKVLFENYANLEGSKTIEITKANLVLTENDVENLNKPYDAKRISNPLISTIAEGQVHYSYEMLVDGVYEEYDVTENGGLPKNAGTYRVTVSITDCINHNDSNTISKVFVISQKHITVVWDNTTLEYTGNGLKPNAYVVGTTYDPLVLTVNAIDNDTIITATEVGNNYTAKVVVNNSNYVIDGDTTQFEITRRRVEIPSSIIVSYTGSQIDPIKSQYYELAQQYNIKDVTTYQVSIRLKDSSNYMWSDDTVANKTISIQVLAKSLADIDVTIDPIKAQSYTGKAITLSDNDLVVRYGSLVLTRGTDYTVSYTDNVNAGDNSHKATVTITGKGNYVETKDAKFVIQSLVLSLADPNAPQEFYRYNLTTRTYEKEEKHEKYDKREDVYIINVHSGMTITEFINLFGEDQRGRINVYNAKGTFVKTTAFDTTYVGTGFKINLLNSNNKIIDSIRVIIRGDVDGDGSITSIDSTLIRKYLNGISSLTKYPEKAADVDRDGSITYLDQSLVDQYLAGQRRADGSDLIEYDY